MAGNNDVKQSGETKLYFPHSDVIEFEPMKDLDPSSFEDMARFIAKPSHKTCPFAVKIAVDQVNKSK